MTVHELAGKPAPESALINVEELKALYYNGEVKGPVSFGTSGHRGSSISGTFNEPHIAATVQAMCEYRSLKDITGPVFMGMDTHALSEPAFKTALEVFAANRIETFIHAGNEFTPTPVISFLILEHNRVQTDRKADGIVITPSHNPPQDGGIKYNPPHGGPADIDATGWIQERANRLMEEGNRDVKRMDYARAVNASTTHEHDFLKPFVSALSQVIDMDIIREAGLKIGTDPMGGSGTRFWEPIADCYGLDIEVVNNNIDPTFRFMTLDSDGLIRMDCSSPYAMAGLISMADRFDIAWGNDPDFDRHGIVCSHGLMNPNHFLSVAIWYLLNNRPEWKKDLAIGKTLVSSSMIDMVVRDCGRKLYEVPVGFKWFVNGLLKENVAFGGEESAGASFLRKNGTVWTTDKDGFCMSLLAAEILARTGKTPSQIYREILVPQYGEPFYKREDGPVTDYQKMILKNLTPESIKAKSMAGKAIEAVLIKAPGNKT